MLLILIPIVWLAVITLVVILCQLAARGDELLANASTTGTVAHSLGRGLTLFEDAPGLAARIRRPGGGHRLGAGSLTVRARAGTRAARSRRAGCVAGS
jgi:hypothetical protein